MFVMSLEIRWKTTTSSRSSLHDVENIRVVVRDGTRKVYRKTPEFIYVSLYGQSIPRSKRFRVMNVIENYFSCYGCVADIGRLKSKYSHLGDFFVVFESTRAAKDFLKCHKEDRRYYLDTTGLGLPNFTMEIQT